MADRPDVISKRFQRSDLAQFLPTPRLIKEFDAISADVTETLPDAIAGVGADADTILAAVAFQPRPPQMPIAGAESSSSILAAGAFQARTPQPPQVTEDATSRILAGQIFGA